ncbi:THAP domain-containing protein 1 B-like [Ischnura elegans]|uniref:THAP domain-containing protein 1 B-like n=1 Tax=Ischnura elegans TaxID=197161 RepID=UPI001ED870D1|nr:THAP domain-containing protein 1 B-like [Ischnura elegans]
MCRRDNWEPTPYSTLCEVHFEESQFESARKDGWKKLKPNAVPTIFDLPKYSKPKRRRPLIRLPADEEVPEVSSFAEVEKPSGVVPEVLHTEELQVHSPQSSEVSYLHEVSSPQSSEVSLSQSSEVSERELLLMSKIEKLERKLRLKEKALQTTRAELYQMRRKFATLPCLHLTRVDASSHGEKGRLGQRS